MALGKSCQGLQIRRCMSISQTRHRAEQAKGMVIIGRQARVKTRLAWISCHGLVAITCTSCLIPVNGWASERLPPRHCDASLYRNMLTSTSLPSGQTAFLHTRHGYRYLPPVVAMPSTRYLCPKQKTRKSGTIDRTLMANMGP